MTLKHSNLGWGFRVASAPNAGAGHMRRCLSLAAAMGRPVTFFLDPGSSWTGMLDNSGIPWVNEKTPNDADRLMQSVQSNEIQNVLFDSYNISSTHVEEATQAAFCVELLDTMRTMRTQSAISAGLMVCDASQHNHLCGPTYAMLSPQYGDAHKLARLRMRSFGKLDRVLVTMGGYDSVNATGFILAALDQASAHFEITVVLGPQALHFDEVRQQVVQMDKATELVSGAEDLSYLMLDHDLVIVAGGVTLLEAACCGTPAITMPFTENQIGQAIEAERQGIAVMAGEFKNIRENDLTALIDVIALDPKRRQRMRDKGLNLIDGLGSKRVAEALLQQSKVYHGS